MWLALLLLSAVLLVRPPKPGELFDPNDPVEVSNWLIGRLCYKVPEPEAQDLTQEALAESIPGGAVPWIAGHGTDTFALHMVYRVTNIRRKLVRRMDHAVEEDPTEENPIAAPSPDLERATAARDRVRRLYADAMAEFANSPKVLPVLDFILGGDAETPDEDIERDTGLSKKQVQNGRARVHSFLKDWRERETGAEARA